MKRWKKVVIWTLSVLVVLGVGGLFAANYAIDKLMNSMASSFEVEDTGTNDAPSGEVTESAVAAEDEAAEPAEPAEPVELAPSAKPLEENTEDSNTTKSAAISEATPSEQVSNADSSKPTPIPTEQAVDGIAQISTDKAKEVQENITIKEKTSVASILLQELSAADIKSLQDLASGGLSNEEKKEARSMILDKLSEDQYNELIQIAKKYGLSQGKSYSEVVGK